MRAAPELWGGFFLLLTDDKERNWRVIGAVEVVGFQYQIFPGVQRLQEVQQCITFLKTGILSAVDAET